MRRWIALTLAARGLGGAIRLARRIGAAQPAAAAPAPSVDLHKEEYAALQKEIENDLKELSELERNTVLAAALVYSWLTTKATIEPPVSYVAWAIPVLLPVYGAARTYAVAHQLSLRGAYLQTVERRLFPDGGWQCYFARQRDSVTTTNWVRKGFWTAFLLLSIVSSVVGGSHSSAAVSKAAAAAAAASAPLPGK